MLQAHVKNDIYNKYCLYITLFILCIIFFSAGKSGDQIADILGDVMQDRSKFWELISHSRER